MSPDETASALSERFGSDVLETIRFRDEVTSIVAKERIIDVGRFLRDELGYNHLSDITAVDWLGRNPRFDVVYHFFSFSHHNWYRVKVRVHEDESVPSMTALWPCANWAEREVYDLFGIIFADHPNLERIEMPEGWVGHPLRKDYPMSQITLPRAAATKIPE
jgi:NADH-quinone oxidoreductase subunit C